MDSCHSLLFGQRSAGTAAHQWPRRCVRTSAPAWLNSPTNCGRVASQNDHRIAMSFLVLGLASRHRVTLDDTSAIAASFPDFVAAMTAVGGRFETVKGR